MFELNLEVTERLPFDFIDRTRLFSADGIELGVAECPKGVMRISESSGRK